MAAVPHPEMVEEALRDCAAFDHGGQLAAAIQRVKLVSAFAQQGGVGMKREHMALAITGDETACAKLASTYTKALFGLGLIDGKAGDPTYRTIDWAGHICDNEASRTLQERGWARRKILEAGKAARSGTLVIRDIHRKPYEGSPDEDEASGPALRGGLEALSTLLTEETWGARTPVIILSGPAAETKAFIAATPELAKLFNAQSVHADAAPAPPVVYPTELESKITVRAPLAFKPRGT